MTVDCGHPVSMLVYFKCANCLSDMLVMYSDNSYSVVARLLHVYTFSVLKIQYKLRLKKVVLCIDECTEGELYKWSITFEVILCSDYICWFACLLIPYFNQQNPLNKYNRTDHKTHSILGTNSCMFGLEGAIFREFIRNKVSYIHHMLQALVTVSSIIKWKFLKC